MSVQKITKVAMRLEVIQHSQPIVSLVMRGRLFYDHCRST
jgi:hypothetical protein